MRRRPKNEDPIQASRRVVDEATRDRGEEKNPAAVALGRLGGLKGGPRRAATMAPERRKEIAQKAAAARWKR